MNNFFCSIAQQLFPSLYVYRINKKLLRKINSKESQSSNDYINEISIDSFRQKYNETFEIKNKFEDKAKTNVIGITIAITVIMGATGLTDTLTSKYSSPILQWVSFLILLVALVYLLISGIDAIKVLYKENIMSMIDLFDLSTDTVQVKKKYSDCINRNMNRNIIRNNILFSSYLCIRNALICLIFLFVLLSIPLGIE